MRRISLLLILSVMLVWAGAAVAQQDNLKGKYAFTGGGACLASFCGFNKADLTPKFCGGIPVAETFTDGALGQTFSRSFSGQGFVAFNGEGEGWAYGTEVDIVPPSSLGLWIEGASSEKFFYRFKYWISDDGKITTWLVPGSFKGKFLTGLGAIYPALTFTIDKKTFSGQASEDTKVLTLTTKAPEVTTVRLSNWEVWYEICHASNTLIRVGEWLDEQQEN